MATDYETRVKNAQVAADKRLELERRTRAIETLYEYGDELLKLINQKRWIDLLAELQKPSGVFSRRDKDVSHGEQKDANWAIHRTITDTIDELSSEELSPGLGVFMSEYFEEAFELRDIPILCHPSFDQFDLQKISVSALSGKPSFRETWAAVIQAASEDSRLGRHLAHSLVEDIFKKDQIDFDLTEIDLTIVRSSIPELIELQNDKLLTEVIRYYKSASVSRSVGFKISDREFSEMVSRGLVHSALRALDLDLHAPTREDLVNSMHNFDRNSQDRLRFYREDSLPEAILFKKAVVDLKDLQIVAQFASKEPTSLERKKVLAAAMSQCRLPNHPLRRALFYSELTKTEQSYIDSISQDLVAIGDDALCSMAVRCGVTRFNPESIKEFVNGSNPMPQTIASLSEVGVVLEDQEFRVVLDRCESINDLESLGFKFFSDYGTSCSAFPWLVTIREQSKNDQGYIPTPDEISRMPEVAVKALSNRLERQASRLEVSNQYYQLQRSLDRPLFID